MTKLFAVVVITPGLKVDNTNFLFFFMENKRLATNNEP